MAKPPMPLTIVIVEDGDLNIELHEYAKKVTCENAQENDQERDVSKITRYQVKREVLIESSNYFKVLCSSFQKVIKTEEDRAESLKIWFPVLRDVETKETLDIPLETMWHLVATREKYDLDIARLNTWFSDWYFNQDPQKLDNHRELLYQCPTLDHAIGIAKAIKALAYESLGHITESNPTEYANLHLF
ncbi:MAG: hypothetical protein MMC33_001107 [Icmadophila ericetorum]|nr:hypothetical protein [Icmadophila ericetorum]